MKLKNLRIRPKEEREDKAPTTSKGARTFRLLAATFLLLLVAFVWLIRVAYVAPSPGRQLSLGGLYDLAEKNKIQSARFLDQDAVIVGRHCLAPPETPGNGSRPTRCYDLTRDFHTAYPASQVATQELLDTIRKSTGAHIVVDRQTYKAVSKLMVTFVLPLLMLANLFGLIFVSRSTDGSAGDIAGFGRFGRKRQVPGSEKPDVTFDQVAGVDEAVVELREVIDYLQDPARFASYGAAPPKGVLLFGPPGCGKTLLARATAGESGVPFFPVAGTEFVESLVGVGAARVRDLFRQVREAAPSILFIDEIDAVGRRRSGEGTSGGEREQTLNQLLVELDGFEVTSGIVLMGATNRPDILDPALMRPGRFDRHIMMEPPDLTGRKAILEIHGRARPFASDVDFGELARQTPGFTGADLANVINEAALLAIRKGPGTQISTNLLSEAVLRVLHGPQRRGNLLTLEERRRLAVHEGGHAIVAAAVDRVNDVHRVSIVARGRALALSAANAEDRTVLTDVEMHSRLTVAMAGVAAEVLVFGGSSSTAEDDISRATLTAREMIGLYGMSTELGRVRLLTRNEGYLDGDGPTVDLMAGPTMAQFDREVRGLISSAEATATQILKANISVLDDLTEALQQHETLELSALKPFFSRVQSSERRNPPRTGGRSRRLNGAQVSSPSVSGLKKTE